MGLTGQYDPMTGTYWTPWGGSNSPIAGVNYGPYAPATNLPVNDYQLVIEDDKPQQKSFGSFGAFGADTLNIPEDAYPWSKSHAGLPDWGLEPLKEIAPRLPGLMDSFQASLDQLDNLPGLVDQWVDASGKAYLGQMQPFQDYIRKPMEGLASRGVLDSTMARDAFTNLGGLLADDFRQNQQELAAKGLEVKSSGLVDAAKLRGMGAEVAGELVNMGREQDSSSEDKLARYINSLAMLLG
ncbi:MAG: hypothetical protein KQH53_08275 [Desulfarculaceae bacterium]|nr:hypothetical protein [Desulfarculaceae bacterium]